MKSPFTVKSVLSSGLAIGLSVLALSCFAQSYHTVGEASAPQTKAVAAVPSATTGNDAAQMAKVKRIIAESHALQAQRRQHAAAGVAIRGDAAQMANVKRIIAESHALQAQRRPSAFNTSLAVKQARLYTRDLGSNPSPMNTQAALLTQHIAQLQQQTDLQSKQLSSQVASLQQQVSTLQQVLRQQAYARQQALAKQQQLSQGFMHHMLANPIRFYSLLGAFILLITLILWWLMTVRRQSASGIMAADSTTASPSSTDNADEDTQQEYDFLGSAEGVPAKLDLARAYIAMCDFDQAKQVLADVMKSNDNDAMAKAKVMMAEMDKAGKK